MTSFAHKKADIAAKCAELADKYLEPAEIFCRITGVAFLSLTVLLFLQTLTT